MTPRSRKLLTEKVQQLRNRKFSALYLGDETKVEVCLDSEKDMEKYYHYAKLEIDNMLNYNSKIENWSIALIVGLYFTALVIVLCGIFVWNSPAVTSTGTISGLGISITWPIEKLLEIRDSNIHLQKFLLIIPMLSPQTAGEMAERILFGDK